MKLSRPLTWLGFALLLGACFLWPRQGGRTGSFAARWLGPIASLGASWQWVRMRFSWERGRSDLACRQAELALELDPGATAGWTFYASHLAHDRGAPDREQDPAQRTLWVEAALEVLERGEGSAREPAELCMRRGTILIQVGDYGGAIPWPGGTEGAWRQAQAAFHRAIELDPGLSEAWAQAAAGRSLRLGVEEIEPEVAERLRALEEALSILDEGERHARHPEVLHFQRGFLLALFADEPDGSLHPLGTRGLYEAAIEAFGRARESGHPLAEAAEESAREALEGLD